MANHRTMATVGQPPTALTVDFDSLYREHGPKVRALAYHRLCDRGQAEDVVQETFLRAYRAIDRLDPERPAWPWLRTIADHICTDMLRRNAVVTELPVSHHERERAMPGEGDPNADAYLRAQRRAGIRDALGEIHPRQRRMLMLQAVEGWSAGAVAEAEGMSVSAVRATLKRGRRSFRRHYLALAARRGLLGAVVTRLKLETTRAQRYAERVSAAGIEAMLPAGFVSVALVVSAAAGDAGPPPLAELHGNPRGTPIVAVTSALVAVDVDVEPPVPSARAPQTEEAGGGPTTGWDASVGTAPGPLGIDAQAGVSAEEDEKFRIGTRRRLPGDDKDTEVWYTLPCEGSITGSVVCKVGRELPSE